MEVDVLHITQPPSGSSSLAQVSIRVHLKTHMGAECPLLIHDIAVIPDQLAGGWRLAMPRYRRDGKYSPAVLFVAPILREIGEAVIPTVAKWKLEQLAGQTAQTSAQDEREGAR